MPETTTVHVSNISPTTTTQELRDFFSFCGKIGKISLSPTSAASGATQSATVTFERSSAANTALLLDQTRLGGNNVHVEAAHTLDEIAGGRTTSANEDEPNFGADTDPTYNGEQGPRQEDKPRSAILAEYLSAGYAVGDTALQKGIDFDQKAGISTRFTSLLQSLDAKFHATEKAKTYDAQYHVTDKLKETQNTLTHYFETALNTPTGKKIRDFYATGAKHVVDIHNEAKRLAELKKHAQQSEVQEKGSCACTRNEGAVCACEGCQKVGEKGWEKGGEKGGENEQVPQVGTAGSGAV